MQIYNQFPKVTAIHCGGYGLPLADDVPKIISTVSNSPSNNLLVFDKSDGPVDNELEYIDWINSLNLNRPYVLVTSNYHYHINKHPIIVHYPRYFFTLLNNAHLVKMPNISDLRPHKISCLNRNPWIHKILNFVSMQKQPWFDDVQKSFGCLYPELPTQYDYLTSDVMQLITTEQADYLKSIYPLKLNIPDDLNKFESNACATYRTCYIDYAPESRHDQTFISEKTWKPIFSGQFFFILGPCGVIDYLRGIGVDVFDDLIDHSYDMESNLVVKVDALMTSITKFLDNNLDQLWIDTYHRRRKNLDLMYNPDFQRSMSDDLFSRVS
jgi:phenylalanine-4-hydroxylase